MDSKQELKEEITRVAYEIYEQRGIPGSELENWLEAERIVLKRLPTGAPSNETKGLITPKKKGGTAKKKNP